MASPRGSSQTGRARGSPAQRDSIRSLDELSPQDSGETVTRHRAKQRADPRPYDPRRVDLRPYRGIREPWDSSHDVQSFCSRLSDAIGQEVLGLTPGPGPAS